MPIRTQLLGSVACLGLFVVSPLSEALAQFAEHATREAIAGELPANCLAISITRSLHIASARNGCGAPVYILNVPENSEGRAMTCQFSRQDRGGEFSVPTPRGQRRVWHYCAQGARCARTLNSLAQQAQCSAEVLDDMTRRTR